ncbi:uncharacterized protein LOC143023832 [Oratosquilla oratoria]|uniref:uncharacterized protein LOC143023832 n=1 Tax=Oratosquilla oratoria TaxID=337810 RepID=UPI003F771751
MREEKIGVIQIYAPQSGRTTEEKEHFYEMLQAAIDLFNERLKIFVIGDWNGHVGVDRVGYEDVIGVFGVGERVLDFCTLNNLKIMNTFFQHRESHKWTWYGWSNDRGEYVCRSMIDLIVCNDKRNISNVKSIPSESMDADHRLVVAKLTFKKLRSRPPPKRRRLNLVKLKEGEIKQRLNGKIADEVTTIDGECELLNVNEDEVADHWEMGEVRNDESLEITSNEVKAAIKRMKNGKSAGCDGLPAEIFKEAEETLLPYLVSMFNAAYKTATVPAEWSKALICPIFKKGDRTVCSNYREISFLPHMGKVYERILEARLRIVLKRSWVNGNMVFDQEEAPQT